MFVVDLHYIVPLEDIEPFIDPHLAFLDEHYASGCFIVSGAKVPRTGGVIIATAESLTALERLLEADPFRKEKLAEYTITEFRPGRAAPQLKE
ncbi:YciI family protein [Hoeflea sp. WL0058]|uniref:YciI family protein n=1 Tax=Flavimaribacter sediminis TaxID=2865987 RepID=A0AAE2ZK73_9HYPH|nr:YciI family protein [Flavimaribacter sediminis]